MKNLSIYLDNIEVNVLYIFMFIEDKAISDVEDIIPEKIFSVF